MARAYQMITDLISITEKRRNQSITEVKIIK